MLVEQGVELDRWECTEKNSLAEICSQAFQSPLADARDIHIVLVLGNAVRVLEQVLNVRPVLHEERIGLQECQQEERGEHINDRIKIK